MNDPRCIRILSAHFDVNPYIDKQDPVLYIDTDNNVLDFDLARSAVKFFMPDISSMCQIISEVKFVVNDWRKYANSIGIPKTEQEMMTPAFKIIFWFSQSLQPLSDNFAM